MFDEINGLPLHPLIVHLAVIAIPVAALCGVAFCVPQLRQRMRIPLVVMALVALVAGFLAKESGEALERVLSRSAGFAGSDVGRLVHRHSERADTLFMLLLAYAVVSVVAFWLSKDPKSATPALGAVLLLLVVGSVAVLVLTYLVGDLGAQAVWNPSGVQNYHAGAR